MHTEVKSLSPLLQSVLRDIPYRRADIQIVVTDTVSPAVGGGDGVRGFIVMVNLQTGESKRKNGSWGGANPWAPTNPVDLDTTPYRIPSFGAVIKGKHGGHGTFATLYVPTAQAQNFLPTPTEALSAVEKHALYCHRAIKGGQYRKDELRRRQVTQSVLDALVARGLLKQDARGFTQITTNGRNAVGDWNGN